MKLYIHMINYWENAIPDIKESKFFNQLNFISMTRDSDYDLTTLAEESDISVVFIDEHEQGCLKKIAKIAKTKINMDIIAAVDLDHTDTGIQALQSGASDFLILPCSCSTFEFYINRALERIYMHQHICFNDNCYKSRFARSQQNYQQLFNEVPCFVFVQDGDYHITDANRKFEEYFGHHIGEYCFGICKNRDEPCRECPVQKTIKDGTNQSSEMEIISSDGVKHAVLCYTAPIRDDNGEVSQALVVLMDITEARRLEDHLTSLGFMIGSISHGIKGLLTSLDGGLYLMETGFDSQRMEKVKEGYLMTKDMTSRIKKLVLDILYYTKTRSLEWEKVSCKNFLEETLGLVAMKAYKKGIVLDKKFETLVNDDIFEIDKNSLQTALVNILENGIEACIDDRESEDKVHTILFQARVDKEKVLFRIQDNGQGMDKSTLKNIFTIFFSSKGNKGTGLGLFIANKVINQHRGEIKVVSTKNRGSKFIIKIPRSVPITARNIRGLPSY
ncbi:MAG: PAS domain-containing protein [Desulfobacter sp.]|nr:PAS domain-containing protein [Desulfobacter sp.]WDP86091.1 MAG: PAS domain-containing protein [Desulfobacter sp.]